MNRLKIVKLPDGKDKQRKITSFFLKPKKDDTPSMGKDILNNVLESRSSFCQLDSANVIGSEMFSGNSHTCSENDEKEITESPLKECSKLMKVEDDCKNLQNTYISPNPHNLSPKRDKLKSQGDNYNGYSPDFVPATPTMIDGKKIRKKGIKRKFNFSKPDSKEKECLHENIENFVIDPQCIVKDIEDKQTIKYNESDSKLYNICNMQNIPKAFINSSKNLDIKVEDVALLQNDNDKCINLNKQRFFCGIETNNSKRYVKYNLESKEHVVNIHKQKKNSNDHNNHILKTVTICKSNPTDQTTFVKSPVKINANTPKKDNKDICYDNSHLFEDFNLDDIEQIDALSLESSVRCQVMSLQPISHVGELVLCLKISQLDNYRVTCVLCDAWATCKLSVGDFVIVSAKPIDGQPGCWKVDNEVGSIVLHPDTLVSGTTLVGSLFCMRRSVLSDGYRGLDSDSKIMVIGSLLHTLLQEVLKKNASTIEDISGIVEQMMSRKQMLFTLYSNKMSLEETRTELETFIPLIHNFVQQYINPEQTLCAHPQKTYGNEVWQGKITGIADIEENIWAPKLGLKGKIDVTVNARIHSRKKVMPLELKTGRASFSAEHRGQVILYTMMMTELGQSVDSGLLLYLREGVMKEIVVGNAECRDLTLLRNQLVYHLETSKQVIFDNEESTTIAVPTLPEPINHHSACSRCPYLMLCSAVLREKGLEKLPQSNPLNALSLVSTEHLKKEHIQYVFHWSGLLRLEHAEAQKNGTQIQNIWSQTPQQREANGSCISNVNLLGDVKEVTTSGYYEHTFTWTGERNVSVREGEYLIVSSSSRVAMAAGVVRQVSDNGATLHLERDLSVRGESCWHLDRYESQTLLSFNLTNLGCLLDDTEEAQHIRDAIISLEIPKFAPKLSSKILKVGGDLLSSLNDGQKSAVFQSIAAQHYVLIKGMPGTGKTATVVSLVLLAVRLGQTVLITSHTHSAVDNVLIRLIGKVDFLRLGSSKRLHPELITYGEENNVCSTPDQLEAFYNSKPVVGVTCLGSGHPLLRRRKFDLCLVDEATQALQPTVLRPLFSTKKFILVGDPDQLSPLVRSQEAKKLGLGVSLFERLDRPAVTTVLTLQYRMNETLTKLANHLTYNGNLSCGNESIQNATLKLYINMEDQPTWIKCALSSQLENAIVVLDTGDVNSTNSNCSNQFEVDIVIQLLAILKKNGIPESDIGVIAPYRDQVLLLKQQTNNTNISVEVNTVDQYQGRDKDVIIYSCTRSSQAKEYDILSDQKRMTVAITRARHKLIFIGNVEVLKGYCVFQKIFTFISKSNFISLPKPL